ncbi:MAG: COX15/CtaA family protein [Anaerolineae bacterium]|nr:COX15/CtaA family protein [Gemmatimonadaceae bacterium]
MTGSSAHSTFHSLLFTYEVHISIESRAPRALTVLRRLSFAALFVAFAHILFGAVVRITGSGMGCGDHWPKCYGAWFPPLSEPTLVIEWSHRLLAAILIAVLAALLLTAWMQRAYPGVGGRGGVLRGAAFSTAMVVATALFGAVTVKLGNLPYATAGHWLLATVLIAALAATLIRAGGFGGWRARIQPTTSKMARGAFAAAGVTLVAVMLGGLTAKIPGANMACQGFPLCRGEVITAGGALHTHVAHRVVALLLLLHVLGMIMASRKRSEAPVVVTAMRTTLALILLQILLAAAMVEMHLPPHLRSLHQAVGVAIWLSAFTFAYLARIASRISVLSATASSDARNLVAGGIVPGASM